MNVHYLQNHLIPSLPSLIAYQKEQESFWYQNYHHFPHFVHFYFQLIVVYLQFHYSIDPLHVKVHQLDFKFQQLNGRQGLVSQLLYHQILD